VVSHPWHLNKFPTWFFTGLGFSPPPPFRCRYDPIRHQPLARLVSSSLKPFCARFRSTLVLFCDGVCVLRAAGPYHVLLPSAEKVHNPVHLAGSPIPPFPRWCFSRSPNSARNLFAARLNGFTFLHGSGRKLLSSHHFPHKTPPPLKIQISFHPHIGLHSYPPSRSERVTPRIAYMAQLIPSGRPPLIQSTLDLKQGQGLTIPVLPLFHFSYQLTFHSFDHERSLHSRHR